MRIYEIKDPLVALKRKLKNSDVELIGRVQNEWLLHFSPHARAIAANGFTHGAQLNTDWNYTKASNEVGYNFGLPIDDYSLREAASMDFVSNKAVVFRASGLLTRHYDGFNQVIFWGPSAIRPFFVIEQEEDFGGEFHEQEWRVTQQNHTKTENEPTDLWTVLNNITNEGA